MSNTIAYTSTIDTANAEAWQVVRTDPARALEIAIENAAKAEQEGYASGAGWAFGIIGAAHTWLGNYEKALEFSFKSLEILRSIGDQRNEVQVLYNIFIIFHLLGDAEKQIHYAQESLNLARTVGDKSGVANGFNGLGTAHYVFGKDEQAIEYLMQGAEIAIEIGDKNVLGKVYDGIGQAYFHLENYPKALEYKNKCLEIVNQTGVKQVQSFAYDGLGEIYSRLEDYPKALEHFQKSIQLRTEMGFRKGVGDTSLHIAEMYSTAGDNISSLKYFKDALKIGEELKSSELSFKAHKGLSDLYEKMGNLQLFVEHFKAYHTQKQVHNSEVESKKLKAFELSGKLEQIQKEKEILEEKNAQLQTYFEDVKTLSEIGNELTSTLDIEGIFNIIYQRINSIMHTSGVFIGLCNTERNTLEVKLAIQKGKRDDFFEYDLAVKNSLPVLVATTGCEVHIGNYQHEIRKYFQGDEHIKSEKLPSVVILPLTSKEKISGVLLVESEKINAFSDHHFNLIKTLAGYISIAIENARLYQNMEGVVKDRTKELQQSYLNTETLNQIGQELISTLNFEDVFERLYSNVNKLMDATIFGVRLFDAEKNTVEYLYEYERGERLNHVSVSMDNLDNYSVWCIRNNKEILIHNNEVDYVHYVSKVMVVGGDFPYSLIFYPLRKGDKVLGAISVQSFDKNVYTDYHVNIVKTLAHYTVIALENARNYEIMEEAVRARTAELVRQKEEVQKSYENTKLLSEVGKEIAAELSIPEIISKVYSNVNNLMDATIFGIGIYRPGNEDLFFPGAMEKNERLGDFSYPVSADKIATRCFNKLEEIIINDWQLEFRQYVNSDYEAAQGEMPESMIYLPLVSKEKKIGVITVQSFERNIYHEYHLNILRTLSVYIASALENASLYKDMEDRVEERTKELIKSHEDSRILNHIGQELISTLDFETVFERLYQNVNKLMDATIFGVRLFDSEKNTVEYLYEYEKGQRLEPLSVSMNNKDNYSVWCIENDKEILIHNNETDYKKYVSKVMLVGGDFPYSLIFYPLRKGDKVLGAISVQSFEKNAYSEYHLNIVKTLAHYTVIALENARNYEVMEEAVRERTAELVSQKEEVSRSYENTKLISEIGRDITSELSVEKINALVYSRINQLMPADGFGIGIYDDRVNKLFYPGYIELDEILEECYDDLEDENMIAGYCFHHDNEIVVGNLNTEYSKYIKKYSAPVHGKAVSSLIYLPLKVKGRKIGVITVQSFTENAYNEYHVNILRSLAVYTAIALDNAGLYQNLEERVLLRTAEIDRAYQNTKLIGQISRDITESLSVEKIIDKVYSNINAVMDATCFGIGIYDQQTQMINMPGFIENGERMELFGYHITDDRLATWCFNNKKEIFISNYFEEYHHYIKGIQKPVSGKDSLSIIYLPLCLKDEMVGLITVQSFKINAYTEYELDILRGLANTIAAAIENAKLYESLEDKVRERTAEVVKQKEIIEEKNKNITDSIIYAKRIQDATLPAKDLVKSYLENSFVLFKPKDIVSGDFYWIERVQNLILFAVVDCTGHGVPGAFLSLIGHNSLNQIVNELKIYQPNKILEELNRIVSKTLHNSTEKGTNIKDGMDMAICSLNLDTNELQFAGAFNPLYLVRNGEMEEIKGDKFPIGAGFSQNPEFTNNLIQLQEGDCIYLFSDGYADQFGGPKGKKFKYSRFKEILVEIHQKEMAEQHDILHALIEEWQGDLEQIDDVCVIGIKP
ncbi:MAG: GAF domain-containing protein [Crocinitomicaceae bacterium]|nr:GAF domain-containing protein [Crocinitomicaceae bacterium]